ncbi:amphi-Trp domain-containing protein [Cereibacter sp. SYSU M97828]|nr:amphi-Trp domain-containing protein [Cereibacter flavus]
MKDDRDFETVLDLTAFVAELRRLADTLEANETFTIEMGGEMVEIPADAGFSIELETEGDRGELEFQLKWGTEEEDDEEEGEDETQPDDRAEVENEAEIAPSTEKVH